MSRKYSKSIIYLSAIFLGVILSTGSIFPMMSSVQAQPDKVVKLVERFDQEDVPPGMTRVTIIHGVGEQRTEIDHGSGKIPPPLQKQDSFECTNDPGTDQCDTNTWRGNQWPSTVNYSVNLKNSGITADAETLKFLDAVNAGIQVWENDPDSSFDANYLGTTGQKTSTAEPRGRMDGSNVIGWGSTKHFGGTVIAVVSYFYYTSTGDMAEADMRFNKDLAWSSNGGPAAIPDPDSTTGSPCCFDVQAIAAHEGGHFAAGLKDIYHNSEKELTMYGYGVEGGIHPRTLGYGDQLSIASAYPSTTSSNPPTLTGITLSPENGSVNVDSSIQFTLTEDYSDGSHVDVTNSALWSSSNSSAASIVQNTGLAQGNEVGSTTITADYDGNQYSASLTINSAPETPSVLAVVDYDTEGGRLGDKHLVVTVTLDPPLSGASVKADLYRDGSLVGSATGTTNTNGVAGFTLKNASPGYYTTGVSVNDDPVAVDDSGFQK